MIDWFQGLIGYQGKDLRLNGVFEVSPEGEQLWHTEKGVKAKGSYDASVYVGRSESTEAMRLASEKLNLQCNPVVLYVSGNPSKFLQGHNVFGPSVSSLAPVIQAMVRGFPQGIRPVDADSSLYPAVHRTRIDITTSVDLDRHRIVHEWLHTAGTSSRSRHGRALVSGDTVYWGKNSTRWAMKAYCKFCELDAHGPSDLKLRNQFKEYCEPQLRLELTLRTVELKPRGTLDESLVWDFMNRIEVGVMKKDIEAEAPHPNLSRMVQLTLSRWLAGEDVRHSLPKVTFYRHRLLIKEQLGLDISLNYEKKQAEATVFDLDYLKSHEIKILPAVMQGYMFKPEKSPKWSADPQGSVSE